MVFRLLIANRNLIIKGSTRRFTNPPLMTHMTGGSKRWIPFSNFNSTLGPLFVKGVEGMVFLCWVLFLMVATFLLKFQHRVCSSVGFFKPALNSLTVANWALIASDFFFDQLLRLLHGFERHPLSREEQLKLGDCHLFFLKG